MGMKRKIIVTLTLESDDPFPVIQNDLDMEISCCWHSFETVDFQEEVMQTEKEKQE